MKRSTGMSILSSILKEDPMPVVLDNFQWTNSNNKRKRTTQINSINNLIIDKNLHFHSFNFPEKNNLPKIDNCKNFKKLKKN